MRDNVNLFIFDAIFSEKITNRYFFQIEADFFAFNKMRAYLCRKNIYETEANRFPFKEHSEGEK